MRGTNLLVAVLRRSRLGEPALVLSPRDFAELKTSDSGCSGVVRERIPDLKYSFVLNRIVSSGLSSSY